MTGESTPGVRQVQDQLDALLQHVGGVLRGAGIRYYLAYGTALGATRHAGYIPWDVDADIHIRREDYPAALAALRSAENDRTELLVPGSRGYEQLFARVGRRGVHHTLLRVDLFPLDPAPSSALAQRAYIRVLHLLARTYMIRAMDVDERRHYSRRKQSVVAGLRILLAPIPLRTIRQLTEWIRRIPARHADSGLLVNSFGSYGSREFFDAEWFREPTLGEFCERLESMPTDTEAYLSQVYGRFSEFPPPESIERELAFAEQHYVRPLIKLGVLEEEHS